MRQRDYIDGISKNGRDPAAERARGNVAALNERHVDTFELAMDTGYCQRGTAHMRRDAFRECSWE